MRQLIKIALPVLVLACIPLGAATMPTITVTNLSDEMVQITPIDEAHKPPTPLDQISNTLPPGAFILTNQIATPINAVVVLWSYTDSNGASVQKRVNCDGYFGGGVPSAIVAANDSTLITPGGCTMREYFDHMAAHKPMLGGSLFLSRNKSILDIANTLAAVRITVDSVIFADGKIWGTDTQHYYKTVSANYWAIRSVVEEITAARAAGQDVKALLQKIVAEPNGTSGYPSGQRKLCASNIHDSPELEITLKFYSDQPPLPEFQHVGGETK